MIYNNNISCAKNLQQKPYWVLSGYLETAKIPAICQVIHSVSGLDYKQFAFDLMEADFKLNLLP